MHSLASLVLGVFTPTGLIIWLVIGLIAGFLASKIMGGGGYGVIGDIIVGLIGAFIGGLIVSLVVPNESFGLIGSIIVSLIGACLLIWLVHMFTGTRSV